MRRAGENKDYQVTVAKAPLTLFFRQVEPGELPPIDQRIDLAYATPRGEVRVGGFGGRGTAPVIVNGQFIGGARGGAFMITSSGVFGARMTNLDAPAAKALGLQPGVLVQDVPEATTASRAGLLPGDIIVAVAGQPVTTLSEVQIASVRLAENRTVKFQIVREKKRRDVTFTWGRANDAAFTVSS